MKRRIQLHSILHILNTLSGKIETHATRTNTQTHTDTQTSSGSRQLSNNTETIRVS